MKILSFNIGKAIPKDYRGEIVSTGIFKHPVETRHKISFTKIEGDEQADLRVHGGADKAVYAYDISHYQHWKNILQRDDWGNGLFGENLTTEGLVDDEVFVGNVYQIGTAKLMAVQPRFPCFKLNIRFGIPDMLNRFMQEKRNGIYFRVIEEGEINIGNEIVLVKLANHGITIQHLVEAYYSKGTDKNLLDKIIAIDELPERLRKQFQAFAS